MSTGLIKASAGKLVACDRGIVGQKSITIIWRVCVRVCLVEPRPSVRAMWPHIGWLRVEELSFFKLD